MQVRAAGKKGQLSVAFCPECDKAKGAKPPAPKPPGPPAPKKQDDKPAEKKRGGGIWF